LAGFYSQERATSKFDAQRKAKTGVVSFNASELEQERAGNPRLCRSVGETTHGRCLFFFFSQRTLPHRPEFRSPDDFRKTRAAPGSVEARNDKTTRQDHLRPPKSRERMLLHSSICPLPSYPPSDFIDMLNQIISYNVRYPTNSVISSGPEVSNPDPGSKVQIQV
jgi:hypothetical protein